MERLCHTANWSLFAAQIFLETRTSMKSTSTIFALPMPIRILAACMLTALLCSCASTSVKSTSKSPDHHGGHIANAAVLAIDERGMVRQGFENRLVSQLRKRGVSASTSFNLLSLEAINHDKPAAAERLRSAGAEAVVMMRLVDSATIYREYRAGPERYAETITGMEMGMWYNYYSVAYMDMSPTYASVKQKIYLETVVFDLKTSKRLWSALTLTSVTENMDRLAEVDTIIEKVIAAMSKDGIVP
jgi:hypothetical protein